MTAVTQVPAFCEGIQYFGDALPGFDTYGQAPAIAEGSKAIAAPTDPTAVYQT
ncbi:MAG: hypothetical protein HC772_18260, partial [Leptolyngbyaceae cyanobacterium CRU_2_3]|nr:hypothetical protein [Leptolyngbyaceae cyanobacterium CRU_2_3]